MKISNRLGLIKFNFHDAVYSHLSEMVCGKKTCSTSNSRVEPLALRNLSDNVAELRRIAKGLTKIDIAILEGHIHNALYVVHIICTAWEVCACEPSPSPVFQDRAIYRYGAPSGSNQKVNRFSLPDLNEVIDAVSFWTLRFYHDDWVDTMKDCSCWIFAKSENCELPDLKTNHNPRYICPGKWGMRMYTYANRRGKGSRFWRFSLLQGIKKAFPVVSPSFIHKSLVGLKQDLETVKVTPQRILDMITRTSRTMFKELNFPSHIKRSHKLSNKSCFESSKREYGPLGYVLRNVDLVDEPICMTPYHPRYNHNPTWVFSNKEQGLSFLDKERLKFFLGETAMDWVVSPLLEPLKVRPITRGPFHSNGVYSDIQRKLWNALQSYPQMWLTQGQDPGLALQEVFNVPFHSERDIGGDFGWKSGDFSAATNKLHSDCTKAAIAGINDTRLRGLLENNLLEGYIRFNEKHKSVDVDDFKMKNGQLMGSLFSFPLLCVINLSLYRLALELWTKRRFQIEDLPVLVNGDDILFYCTKDFEKFWSSLVRTAGLIPSKGKDYWSRSFAMVNSTYIRTEGMEFKEHVPYFNMGLYSGRKKGDSDLVSDSDARSFREKLLTLPGYFKDYFKYYDSSYNIQYNKMIHVTKRDRWDLDLTKSAFGNIELGLHLPCRTFFDKTEKFYLENYPCQDDVDVFYKHTNVREQIKELRPSRRICKYTFERSLFWDIPEELPSYPRRIVPSYSGRVTKNMETDLLKKIGLICTLKDRREFLINEFFSSQKFISNFKSCWA